MSQPKNNRVFITGANVISSLGLNMRENWENLVKGRSGVKTISLFDASDLQTRIAAEVPAMFNDYAASSIKKRAASQMTRVTKMCFVCAKDAIQESGIDFSQLNPLRTAVILGVVNTANSSVEKDITLKNTILKGMNNSMSAWISLEYNIQGPNYTIATACASSAYALANGYELIASGRADVVIVGGADSIINREEIMGFNELYALSVLNEFPEKASKPFSADRDGFVIGEGAGILILESESSALKRNANIIAEFSGYGLSSEAYNIMAPKADGEGMALTMELALQHANVGKNEVDYINAHGTSTTMNDLYETMAIKKVFGERAYHIPVSSSKSMLGHTIGAAGAIESAITAWSIKGGWVTPTINLVNPDPDLDLDYVPNTAREHNISHAISNSFAFGGHNASLVFSKYQ